MLNNYEQRFPGLPWREPLPVRILGGNSPYYCCRLCVARHGLKATEIKQTPFAFACEADCRAHLASAH